MLKKRNSLSQALIQQYDMKVDKNNKKDKTGIVAAEKFFEIERTVLKEMCKVAEIELTPSKKSNRENYSVKEYKELQERKEYYQEDILKLEEELEKKKAQVVKNKKANELLLADKRYQKIIADIKKLDNKKDKIIAKILSENIRI